MDYQIKPADPATGQLIERALLMDLRRSQAQAENSSIVLAVHVQRELIGGLTASTSYGWLHVVTLWVDEAYRKEGLGRALMQRAEAIGRQAGCHSCWLDTSNPSAKAFYEKLDYIEFGRIDNSPDRPPVAHSRCFMKKRL